MKPFLHRPMWSLWIILLAMGIHGIQAQEVALEQGSVQEAAGEVLHRAGEGALSNQVDEKSVFILWSRKSDGNRSAEADQFMDYLIQSLRTALYEAQYPVADRFQIDPVPAAPIETALRYGKERQIRWVFVADLVLSESSLSWSIGVYDALRESLRASDSFSAFPGLSALPYLDDSCRSVVQAWLGVIAEDEAVRDLAEQAQRFYGPQDGVQVWYGSQGSGVLAGTIEQGKLEGAYIPFPEGQPLYIHVTKEGYWPRSLVLPEGVRDRPVRLPPLQKKSLHIWGLGTGRGRLLGASFLYRYYPLPDRLFLRFDNSLWAGYSFLPGAVPFWHDELRFGMGLYLQNRSDGAFRAALGTGGAGIISLLPGTGGAARTGLDILLDPLWFSVEYHFPRWALFTEFRMPYASGTGFLSQGWLEPTGGGPLFLLGVLFK